jgi:hypothetical protein
MAFRALLRYAAHERAQVPTDVVQVSTAVAAARA